MHTHTHKNNRMKEIRHLGQERRSCSRGCEVIICVCFERWMNGVKIALICRATVLPSGLMSVPGWPQSRRFTGLIKHRLRVGSGGERGGGADQHQLLALLFTPLHRPNSPFWSQPIYLYHTHTHMKLHSPLVWLSCVCINTHCLGFWLICLLYLETQYIFAASKHWLTFLLNYHPSVFVQS